MGVEYPDAIYHAMNRGDRGEDIFINGVDRQDFLKTLKDRILSKEFPRPGRTADQEGHPRASRGAWKRRIRCTRFVALG